MDGGKIKVVKLFTGCFEVACAIIGILSRLISVRDGLALFFELHYFGITVIFVGVTSVTLGI